jgi:hypothetical protein
VIDTFGSVRGFIDTAKAAMGLYPDPQAAEMLSEPARPVHSFNPLVQIQTEQVESNA